MQTRGGTDLQQQIDELVALVAKSQGDIDALVDRADQTTARITVNRADIDQLQEHVALDRQLIAELQADGFVSREHVAQLEKALATSRTIGAAVGVLMASRGVGQDEALRLLREASSRANTPMRELAEVIVAGQKKGEVELGG
ncbi:ANTAR domain-containing protein [Microbacterium sp. ARD31]|uniref:ANTAR domain-containing protein n=1 Tax=Microbacterium sp. ARD31 TaxID=2962576 RepID=UPI00288125F0|nr:ANTAR domain-containing protein [Microbacterium sp. ARD31]MDT0183437.1 ANTAR domain-containing protein [Microbacterium sp. ARD31]